MLIGERPHGTFSRQLFLAETLDTDRLNAEYRDGVLTLRVPVKEQAKPRRVSINAADGASTAIETGTAEDRRHPVDATSSSSTPGRAAAGAARPPGSVGFPAADVPLYTVGQVADMLGVQPAYLRRLDAHDVVRPSRSTGRQRRYSKIDIDRIGAITTLIGEGMTLVGAHRILELQAEIDDLRRRLAELRKRTTKR